MVSNAGEISSARELNDILVSRVMSGAMTPTLDFISAIGVKSGSDVFGGSAPINLDTSSTMTSARVGLSI